MKDKNNQMLNFTWMLKKGYENSLESTLIKHNLSQNEGDVLLFLYNNNDNTANDISKFRFISKSLVSKSINNLHKRGYLNLEADCDDKRIKRLYISKQAQSVTKELFLAQKEFYKLLEKDISDDDLKIVNNILKQMYKNVNEKIESI